jgi:hypothetical protein
MGFSLVTDEPIGEEPSGARWIEVRPPHSAVTLVLYSLTFDVSRLGSLSPVLFTCHDIQKTHQELTARGVEFPDLCVPRISSAALTSRVALPAVRP